MRSQAASLSSVCHTLVSASSALFKRNSLKGVKVAVSPGESLTAPRNDIELCDYPAASVPCEHTRARAHPARGRQGPAVEQSSVSGLVIMENVTIG